MYIYIYILKPRLEFTYIPLVVGSRRSPAWAQAAHAAGMSGVDFEGDPQTVTEAASEARRNDNND